ncbi:MAG: riboflavin synthase [Sphingobacteriaceae bacterium]|nr:riboflavin synthase [Sphingobacteriaceae bacterium]
MFTGIIEALGTVVNIRQEAQNIHYTIASSISGALKVDQSVSHNGVCLTVVDLSPSQHTVTAILETLQKTNLKAWEVGAKINLERCMPADGRFDGHIVQGHVDQTAECIAVADEGGSWRYRFAFDPSKGNMVVEKGSICVNGVSLTVVDAADDAFSVAIIPYTYEHTSFHQLQLGSIVNLEFDIVGKYIQRMMQKQLS